MAVETEKKRMIREKAELETALAQSRSDYDNLFSQNVAIVNDLKQKEEKFSLDKEGLCKKYDADVALQKEICEQEKGVLITENVALEDSVKQKNQLIKSQQKKLNDHELKKMASAYATQENLYETSVKFWERTLAFIVFALLVSTVASIYFAYGKPWYDRFEFYLVDFIFLSAVWFSASQYSYYVHLRADYANRKTIAQSYHNILLSIGDEHSDAENNVSKQIKERFIDKATDVLCAPSFTNIREPLLTKELVKNVTEITKGLSGK